MVCGCGRPLTSTQDRKRPSDCELCPWTSAIVHRHCCQIAVKPASEQPLGRDWDRPTEHEDKDDVSENPEEVHAAHRSAHDCAGLCTAPASESAGRTIDM